MKICSICNENEANTIDHVIPKWLVRRVRLFGFDISIPFEENTQPSCSECNSDKGGMIDYSNPKVISFLNELIEKLQIRINLAERPTKIETDQK